MSTIQRRLCAALSAFALVGFAVQAQPSDYPKGPVRFVVPYQAGSTPDLMARHVAERLAGALRQPVVVDNKPGAGGMLGASLAAKAVPDGLTLVYLANQHLVHPYVTRSMPYDLLKDFSPVALLGSSEQVLVVPAASPYKNTQSMVEAGRAQAGKLTFGTGGIGSPAHLGAEALAAAGNFQAIHIPFKGAPETLNALIGGQIDFTVTNLGSAIPYIKNGQVRALAVTGAQRTALLPEVPTMVEAVPPGFVFETWGVVAVPAGVPLPVQQQLNALIKQIVTDPAGAEFWSRVGLRPAGKESLTEVAAFLSQQARLTQSLARAAGLKPE